LDRVGQCAAAPPHLGQQVGMVINPTECPLQAIDVKALIEEGRD